RAPAQARLAALGDLAARFAGQPGVRVKAGCVETATACVPVDLAAGPANLPQGARALRLTLALSDRGGGIGNVDLFVNGRNVGREAPPAAGTARVEVPLDPGRDRLRVRVYDRANAIYAETPLLTLASARARTAGAGRLFVLAIGIDHFAAPSLTLHSAVSDATDFAHLAAAAGKRVFASEHVVLLTDAQATRAGILAAFARLATEVRPEDTFLFYVASHGARAEGTSGAFLLVPEDVSDLSSWDAVARQAIGERALVAALAAIRARDALLFIDTCYSGAVSADALANVGHETGRYLISAASSVQEALDTYDGKHGLMVYALARAFAGDAPHGTDGMIGALSLGEYLSREIDVLARRKGFTQNAMFKTAQENLRSFPVGAVLAAGGK
ncbi:MAG: caspase family protein, partial [Rhodospirillales bacterium]|nr:caspase family protein [Rhodospirillales bacterium]